MIPPVDYKHFDMTEVWSQFTSIGSTPNYNWSWFTNLQPVTYSASPSLNTRQGQEILIRPGKLEFVVKTLLTNATWHVRFFLLALETPIDNIDSSSYHPTPGDILDCSVTSNWFQADWKLKEQRNDSKPHWVVLKDVRRKQVYSDNSKAPMEIYFKFKIPGRRIEYDANDINGTDIAGGRPLFLGLISDFSPLSPNWTYMYAHKIKFLDNGSKR